MSQNKTTIAETASQLTMLLVNDTGLPDDQVYITFQDPGQTLNATYGTGATPVGRVNPGDVMTQSLRK